MAGSNGRYSNKDIFDSQERLRLELKSDILSNTTDLRQDIRSLRADFNTMEAGRLTKAENKINKLEIGFDNQLSRLRANQSITNSKILIIWGLVVVAINFIASFMLRSIFK